MDDPTTGSRRRGEKCGQMGLGHVLRAHLAVRATVARDAVSTLPLPDHDTLMAIVARAIVDADAAQQTAARLQRDADVLRRALYQGMTDEEHVQAYSDLGRRIDRERLKRGAQ
jgi:hypothetical protein